MFVAGTNHGSAAVAMTAAALPPPAAGRLTLMPLPSAAELIGAVLSRTQSPSASAAIQAASESLGMGESSMHRPAARASSGASRGAA